MSKIIITRPLVFAGPLQSALKKQNIDSFIFPTLAIDALSVNTSLASFDYVIFVSRNAVTYGQHLLTAASRTLVIGQATYDSLQQVGYTPLITPEKPYNSETFLEHPQLPIKDNDRVAIIKGEGGRNLLQQALTARGVSVQNIDVYQRKISQPDKASLQELVKVLQHDCKAIFINSIETLHNLLTLTPDQSLNTLLNQQLITGSQRVVAAADKAGFILEPLLANSTTDHDMVSCLLAAKLP